MGKSWRLMAKENLGWVGGGRVTKQSEHIQQPPMWEPAFWLYWVATPKSKARQQQATLVDHLNTHPTNGPLERFFFLTLYRSKPPTIAGIELASMRSERENVKSLGYYHLNALLVTCFLINALLKICQCGLFFCLAVDVCTRIWYSFIFMWTKCGGEKKLVTWLIRVHSPIFFQF